ncbi:protein tramtrack, beta isoform-like isoform X3 [Limulus polyphemus]|uniref:Protein tramtrack, beta isoform-like isoform X3 n=1 Tax=Limulus polyphemus TaxID=6850 RepID=A0ABM1B8I5_LIMPO|nr:protein tramtrack, beta isoform-like isoform X3 [Limulus polyphemus]
MGTQQFCLKWNNHHSNMLSVFEQLLNNEALVDVTLACEGHSLKAHKVVLSACSPFFQTLFVDNPCKHPIVIMKDMRYVDMKAIIDFIYHGEVNVSQDQLSALLKTAETLKVKGLAEVGGEKQAERQNAQEVSQQPVTSTQTVSGNQHHRTESPLVHKRKRGRPRRRSGSSQSDTEEPIPSKIKEPDSPEIISDISRDGLNESTPDVSQRLPSVSQSRVPPIPSNQSYSLSSQKSHSMYSPVPSQQESSATIEEPPSITDGDFDVEPSRLMEATLTTDASGVSMYESQAQAALPSTSTSLALPPASAVELPQSNSLSQAIVPTSLHSASDSSGSGLGSQNTMEDIKPLVSFEEPPIGVTSHSHDSSSTNAVLPYMDTSGVPAIPGPSSFQPDMSMQPSPQQTSQGSERTGFSPLRYHYRHSASEYRNAVQSVYQCPHCSKKFKEKRLLKQHMNIHNPRNSFSCDYCGETFRWRQQKLIHMRRNHDFGQTP